MIFRHRLFTSSIKLKIKQFHIVVVRKLQRNVQKKYATRAKLLFCLLNLLLLLLLLFVCVVFWRSRCPCVVGSSSPYLSGTRQGDGCIFFLLTRLPTSLHASPRQKKNAWSQVYQTGDMSLFLVQTLGSTVGLDKRCQRNGYVWRKFKKTYLMDLRSSLNRLKESG